MDKTERLIKWNLLKYCVIVLFVFQSFTKWNMGQSFLNFDNEQVKGLRMWKVKLPCCYLSKLCPNLNSIWARLFIEKFFIFSRHLFICFFNVAESKQTASVSYFLRWNVSLHHLSVVDNTPFLDFQQLGTLKCSLRLAFPPADVFPVTFASFFLRSTSKKGFSSLLSDEVKLRSGELLPHKAAQIWPFPTPRENDIVSQRWFQL